MSKVKTLFELLANPKSLKMVLLKSFGKNIPDEKYLKMLYKLKTGHELNLDYPKTYTEKIQWLKLYDRRPEYTKMQDKYAVREFIKETIGEEYLIPLLGVWDRADDIDFDALPDQFVIKCNHDCASVIICRDKSTFDKAEAKRHLQDCLQKSYYPDGREWAYRDIKPKIIAEKYMQDSNEKTLTDYKFFCFSGIARLVLVTSGPAHTPERRVDFYDIDFNSLPIKRGEMSGSGHAAAIKKPKGFDSLVQLAEKLSAGIPFVRMDFYLIEGHPFFGEVAFYPSGGMAEFKPYEWEERVGSWIILPSKTAK